MGYYRIIHTHTHQLPKYLNYVHMYECIFIKNSWISEHIGHNLNSNLGFSLIHHKRIRHNSIGFSWNASVWRFAGKIKFLLNFIKIKDPYKTAGTVEFRINNFSQFVLCEPAGHFLRDSDNIYVRGFRWKILARAHQKQNGQKYFSYYLMCNIGEGNTGS
jgi:hypothetical protein